MTVRDATAAPLAAPAARPWAGWALGVWLDYGLLGIWIALSGELVVRGLLFLWRFWSKGWERLRV